GTAGSPRRRAHRTGAPGPAPSAEGRRRAGGGCCRLAHGWAVRRLATSLASLLATGDAPLGLLQRPLDFTKVPRVGARVPRGGEEEQREADRAAGLPCPLSGAAA